MAKLFSGLTLVIALVATFFGFQSKEMVEKLRTAADREHADVQTARETAKKAEAKLKTAEEEVKAAKDDLSKTQLDLTAAKTDLDAKKTELAAATEKKPAIEAELADAKQKLKALTDVLGGKPPEELLKAITEMETAKKDLEGKVQTLDKEKAELTTTVETLTALKKDFDEKLASQRKMLERYQKNIMQKGVRGSVLAVNAGWGFCVLSIGDRQGAAANKIMIVARDGQSIGKVKIINVEASQSVADIIPSSFVRGTYIQPGDDVIFTGEDKVREEPATAPGTAPAGNNPPGVPELPKQ